MKTYKDLSFDGHGINGMDEYRTRLATFTCSEGRAFGSLFAAAPELLEALDAIFNGSGMTGENMDKARAAIAKAKGE
jgi:hypothetical protein